MKRGNGTERNGREEAQKKRKGDSLIKRKLKIKSKKAGLVGIGVLAVTR
jgi:hypothetical protein